MSTFIKSIIVLASLSVLAAVAIPNYIKARSHRSLNECVDKNQWEIADAKQRWAEQYRKAPGSIPTEQDLLPYLPNKKMPECPMGGTYILNPVGVHPSCSLSDYHPWSETRLGYDHWFCPSCH